MTFPLRPTTWATDINYPAGAEPWSGLPTKNEPTATTKQYGFTPEQPASAEEMNYVLAGAAGAASAAATLPALNIVALASLSNVNAAAYNPVTRLWMLTGDSAAAWYSGDTSQPVVMANVAAAGAGENCHGLDFDASGGTVIATHTQYVFALDASLFVSKVSPPGGALAGSTPCVVAHDPILGKWCWVGSTGVAAAALAVRTSTNRTTWSAGTNPTGFSTSVINKNLVCRKDTGVMMLVGSNATTGKVAVTYDAGANWTVQPNCARRPIVIAGIGPS